MENDLANRVDELKDGERWETLRAAINLARIREKLIHGRTDMFVHFVYIEMQSQVIVNEALRLLEAVGIKAYNIRGCGVEIHSLPSIKDCADAQSI